MIHQVIRALEWGGDRVNTNEGMSLRGASTDGSIKCGDSLEMDDRGERSTVTSKL